MSLILYSIPHVDSFVYLKMGGQRADILVELLGDKTADLTSSLANFDAGKAQCYLDKDRQGLLAVIEASFGTFEPFNTLVRGVFSQQLSSSGKSPDAWSASFVELVEAK